MHNSSAGPPKHYSMGEGYGVFVIENKGVR